MRRSVPTLHLVLLVATQRSLALSNATATVNGTECGCFLTNGTTPTYYASRVFFDFRDLSEFADVPNLINDEDKTTGASVSSDYFDKDEWKDVWELQNWNNKKDDGDRLSSDAAYLMLNTPNNVYIEKNEDKNAQSKTFLTMRASRQKDFASVAEFESTAANYRFLSIRMLARTVGSKGACTAMFTYRDVKDLASVQEADIEILTSGPRNRIQYTNQPSYDDDGHDFPEATRNATIPGGKDWSDWVVHRLDWTPDQSIWYVDGEEAANIKFQTPRDASRVHFNAWSNGGSWTGNMTKGDEAFMQVQWIEMVYNTTDENVVYAKSRRWDPTGLLSKRKSDGARCKAVCSIDQTDGGAGDVALLWESAASPGMYSRWSHSKMLAFVSLSLAACLFF